MVNQELVSFIRKAFAQGNSRSEIEEALAKKGWTRAQIGDGFSAVSAPGKAAEKSASSSVSFLKSKTFLWALFAVALIALVIVGAFLFFPSAEEEVECTRDRDCDSGFTCEEEQCVEEEILAAEGEECALDRDCDEGFACDDGSCVEEFVEGVECLVDEDCLSGFVCDAGSCVEEDTSGPSITIVECTDNANCSAGYLCSDTSCEPEYNLTVTCAESDSAYNLTLLGSTAGIWYANGSSVNFTDSCNENRSEIMEYWCPGAGEDYEGYVYGDIIACASGFVCSDGACEAEAVICSSDADCASGFVCSVDGACEAEAVITACDSDCAPYACDTTSGTCETSCDYDGDWSECADMADGYGCALDDTCVGGSEITITCSEDDISSVGNGYIVTAAGTTTGTSYYDGADASWTDFCTADGELVEYWCPGAGEAFEGYAYGKIVDCSEEGLVCDDGACVERAAVLSIADVIFEGSTSDFSAVIFNVEIENTGNTDGGAAVSCTLDLSDAFIGTPTVTASLETSASATIGAEESATLSCIFDITDVKNDLISAGTSELFGPMTATLGEATETIIVVLEQEDLFGECLADADCADGFICDFDQFGVCVATECNDGIDNDGNGDVDLDDVFGCDDADDTNEYTERCMDGEDNDDDGFRDYSGAMVVIDGDSDYSLIEIADRDFSDPILVSCDSNYPSFAENYYDDTAFRKLEDALAAYWDVQDASSEDKISDRAYLNKNIGCLTDYNSGCTCEQVCDAITYGYNTVNDDFSTDAFTLVCYFEDPDPQCSNAKDNIEGEVTIRERGVFAAPEAVSNFFQKIWDFIAKAPPVLHRLLGE